MNYAETVSVWFSSRRTNAIASTPEIYLVKVLLLLNLGKYEVSEVTIECLGCGYSTAKAREWFLLLIEDDEPNVSDINQIIHRLTCSNCGSHNVKISTGGRLFFDTSIPTNCQICRLIIPIPRLEAEPNTLTCVRCVNEGFKEFEKGPTIPEVPTGMRGKCPRCKKTARSGIVVVYQNASEKNFFLGCSSFPQCRWSSNAFYSKLNG